MRVLVNRAGIDYRLVKGHGLDDFTPQINDLLFSQITALAITRPRRK